ncbi:hypothetical protein [Paractinoplanes durhamensis]|uniref:hypothetical protein n=1 Tax=Paractinoplanes durhamensis TaxID=113563 RepID=UPI003629771A
MSSTLRSVFRTYGEIRKTQESSPRPAVGTSASSSAARLSPPERDRMKTSSAAASIG